MHLQETMQEPSSHRSSEAPDLKQREHHFEDYPSVGSEQHPTTQIEQMHVRELRERLKQYNIDTRCILTNMSLNRNQALLQKNQSL